jgi:hypothetical protein
LPISYPINTEYVHICGAVLKGSIGVTVIPARYGVIKRIKSGIKTDKLMAKAEITIPLGIPDVRVIQTSLSERGEINIRIESTKAGTPCW